LEVTWDTPDQFTELGEQSGEHGQYRRGSAPGYSLAVPAPSTGVGAVAIWTSADRPGLGDQLLGRVIQQELLTRLPGWRMSMYSPEGWHGLADAGLVTEPLRGRTADELTAAATITVVCTDDPVAVALADGLTHPVVPFPPYTALSLDRVVDKATLPARVEHLRALGELPDGDYDLTTEPAADLAFDDRIAALSGARKVITDDGRVAAACAWLGVDCRRPDGSAFAPAPQAGYDDIAELAEKTLVESGRELASREAVLAEENQALRLAHWNLRTRMLVERQHLAEPLADALRERDAANAEAADLRTRAAELTRRNEEMAARLAHVESELAAWRDTKLVRWTRPLRDAYGRTRG
jgi:hypothetical protein